MTDHAWDRLFDFMTQVLYILGGFLGGWGIAIWSKKKRL